MERTECPNAMMMATTGIVGHQVPLNQPNPSSLKLMLRGNGAGGVWAGPRINSVSVHHTRKITTITVVSCMIRKAFVLDSCKPLMLLHQKYIVTKTAKKTANCAANCAGSV